MTPTNALKQYSRERNHLFSFDEIAVLSTLVACSFTNWNSSSDMAAGGQFLAQISLKAGLTETLFEELDPTMTNATAWPPKSKTDRTQSAESVCRSRHAQCAASLVPLIRCQEIRFDS